VPQLTVDDSSVLKYTTPLVYFQQPEGKFDQVLTLPKLNPKLTAAVSQSACGTSSRLFDWHVPNDTNTYPTVNLLATGSSAVSTVLNGLDLIS
jgi:hypothetical protein